MLPLFADGRYKVLHKFGGSSTIWLARDSVSGILVALKVLSANKSTKPKDEIVTLINFNFRPSDWTGFYVSDSEYTNLPFKQLLSLAFGFGCVKMCISMRCARRSSAGDAMLVGPWHGRTRNIELAAMKDTV